MELLPISEIKIDFKKINIIDDIMKSVFRLIVFSREHLADDLLNSYITSTTDLKNLLSIKNAQMEAQTEQEVNSYIIDLNKTLAFVVKEIKKQISFSSELQLFQLLRLISPESHLKNPNKYRTDLVQIGGYICPEGSRIHSLVSELFYNMNQIENPIIRAIYFHHEMIRIHPFIDGNGRTTRIAKNWMLMYHLFPPVFIRDKKEKTEYICTLSKSFSILEKKPKKWNNSIEQFFNQEIARIYDNALLISNSVRNIGMHRVYNKENEQNIF